MISMTLGPSVPIVSQTSEQSAFPLANVNASDGRYACVSAMFGYSSDATAILGAVILSVVLTLVLLAFRLGRGFPGLCLIGLGLTPLIAYSALYAWLPHPPFHISILSQILLRAAFGSPNLLLSFLIAIGALFWAVCVGSFRSMERKLCPWLCLIHLVGLMWAHWLLTYRS